MYLTYIINVQSTHNICNVEYVSTDLPTDSPKSIIKIRVAYYLNRQVYNWHCLYIFF